MEHVFEQQISALMISGQAELHLGNSGVFKFLVSRQNFLPNFDFKTVF